MPLPSEYQKNTAPFSQYLSEETYARWGIERPCHSEHRSKKGDEELPPHSGPRTPLDYQLESIASLNDIAGVRQGALLALPTGGGKTFTALTFALDWLERNSGDVLWLAPMTELISQATWECRRVWWSSPRSYFAEIKDRIPASRDKSNAIVFSTIQSALRREKGHTFKQHENWSLVIVDECHYLARNKFGAISSAIGAQSNFLLGLSATPGRRDPDEFDEFRDIFHDNLVVPSTLGSDPITELRRRSVYADVLVHSLTPTVVGDNDRYLEKRRDGTRAQTLAALSPGRLDAVVKCVCEDLASSSVLVFCRDLEHCEVVASSIHSQGGNVAVVGSSYSSRHNKAEIEKFKRGIRRVLVNAKYLAVGTDIPNAEAVVLTVPFTSPILFEQILGRISRGTAVGGTEKAHLYDFDDHYKRFGGPQGYGRFISSWLNIHR